MPASISMNDVVSKDNFLSFVESERNVTVTDNTNKTIHCLSNSEYEGLQVAQAKTKLLSRILLAEKEIANGEAVDYDDFANSLKAEYGFTRTY